MKVICKHHNKKEKKMSTRFFGILSKSLPEPFRGSSWAEIQDFVKVHSISTLIFNISEIPSEKENMLLCSYCRTAFQFSWNKLFSNMKSAYFRRELAWQDCETGVSSLPIPSLLLAFLPISSLHWSTRDSEWKLFLMITSFGQLMPCSHEEAEDYQVYYFLWLISERLKYSEI